MINYFNFISIYLKIKKNIKRLKDIKLKYKYRNNQFEKENFDKYIYQKMKKKIISNNKIISNEIKKNHKLIKYLKKLQK